MDFKAKCGKIPFLSSLPTLFQGFVCFSPQPIFLGPLRETLIKKKKKTPRKTWETAVITSQKKQN